MCDWAVAVLPEGVAAADRINQVYRREHDAASLARKIHPLNLEQQIAMASRAAGKGAGLGILFFRHLRRLAFEDEAGAIVASVISNPITDDGVVVYLLGRVGDRLALLPGYCPEKAVGAIVAYVRQSIRGDTDMMPFVCGWLTMNARQSECLASRMGGVKDELLAKYPDADKDPVRAGEFISQKELQSRKWIARQLYGAISSKP